MKTETYQHLQKIVKTRKAGFVLLLDPDKVPTEKISDTIQQARDNGVDCIFVGGTLLLSQNFDPFVRQVKQAADSLPVILFPGSVFQVSSHADAILYLSVISGRNPAYLIDNQVLAAPVVWQSGIETGSKSGVGACSQLRPFGTRPSLGNALSLHERPDCLRRGLCPGSRGQDAARVDVVGVAEEGRSEVEKVAGCCT